MTNKMKISLRLNKDEANFVDSVSKQTGLNKSTVIRLAINSFNLNWSRGVITDDFVAEIRELIKKSIR